MTLAAAMREDEVAFRSITDEDIVKLKQINNIIFPINYSPRFYTEILNPVHAPFCKLGSFSSSLRVHALMYRFILILVGSLCAGCSGGYYLLPS